MNESKKTRAVIYSRISADKKRDGAGTARQIELCRQKAVGLGATVVDDSYRDKSVSASTGAIRPEFERLLTDARAGKFDAVIVWHIDRLYRRPADLQRLVEALKVSGVIVHQVTAAPIDLSTPTGILQAGVHAQIAQYEIDHKAERQAAFYDRILAEGKPKPGGPRAFGFEAGGVAHRADEAELIRAATKHILEGGSIGSVIRQWNDQGIKAARGGEWGYTSLRTLLMRYSNAGIRQRTLKDPKTGSKTIVEHGKGSWDPIVSEAEFRALRGKLEDPSRIRHRGDVGRKHMLSHILTCGKCGQPMRAGSTTTRAGVRYLMYQCPGQKTRCRLGIDYEAVTEVVMAHVVERIALPGPDLIELTADEREAAGNFHRRLSEIERDEIIVEEGPASLASKQRQLGLLRVERQSVEDSLSHLTRRMALSALLLDQLPVFTRKNGKTVTPFASAVQARKQARERFDGLDLDRKREIIRALLRVHVEPALKGIRPTKFTARDRVKLTPLDPRTGQELSTSKQGEYDADD